jgi:hypothetical protein
MNYGKNIAADGTVNFGELVFSTGKRFVLSSEECAEVDARLLMAKAEGKLVQQNHQRQDKDHYLLIMESDISSNLQGPFNTEDDRDNAALKHRAGDPEREDGLFMLTVSKGAAIEIDEYSNGFFEEVEDVQRQE